MPPLLPHTEGTDDADHPGWRPPVGPRNHPTGVPPLHQLGHILRATQVNSPFYILIVMFMNQHKYFISRDFFCASKLSVQCIHAGLIIFKANSILTIFFRNTIFSSHFIFSPMFVSMLVSHIWIKAHWVFQSPIFCVDRCTVIFFLFIIIFWCFPTEPRCSGQPWAGLCAPERSGAI